MGARSSQSRGPGLNETDGHLLEYFRNTFGAGGGGTNFVPVPPSGLTATGGVISDYTTSPGDVYRAHIFTSSGELDVTALGTFGNNVEALVVAGGGGGGSHSGGGGGAGGLLLYGSPTGGKTANGSALPVGVQSYTVTIGNGGAGASAGAVSLTLDVAGSFGNPAPDSFDAAQGSFGNPIICDPKF